MYLKYALPQYKLDTTAKSLASAKIKLMNNISAIRKESDLPLVLESVLVSMQDAITGISFTEKGNKLF